MQVCAQYKKCHTTCIQCVETRQSLPNLGYYLVSASLQHLAGTVHLFSYKYLQQDSLRYIFSMVFVPERGGYVQPMTYKYVMT